MGIFRNTDTAVNKAGSWATAVDYFFRWWPTMVTLILGVGSPLLPFWRHFQYLETQIGWFIYPISLAAFFGLMVTLKSIIKSISSYFKSEESEFQSAVTNSTHQEVDIFSNNVIVNCTRHIAFNGTNRICLGFTLYPLSDLFDAKIRCTVCEKKSGWQFYDETEFEGDLFKNSQNEQFYPSKIWVENEKINYSPEISQDKVLSEDDALIFSLTLTKRGFNPQIWEFEVSENTNFSKIIRIKSFLGDETTLWPKDFGETL